MSDREKKYLDDEQVKKNLDKFNNDGENFLKNSSYLDNIGVSYNIDNTTVEKRTDTAEKENVNDDLEATNNKIMQNEEKTKSTYVWIPIFLSFLMLIMIFIYIIYFYCKSGIIEEIINPGGSEGSGVAFLYVLITFLPLFFLAVANFCYVFLGIWLFYFLWFLIKIFIFKNEENCELKVFFVCICFIIILLIVLKLVGVF